MAQWKKLTRDDVRAFDESQTKAILYAMDHGGVGRISSSGHAIIRNDQGQTMSVSRSSGGRRKMNVARDLCRLFGAPVEEEQKVKVPATVGSSALAPVPEPTDSEPVRCTVKGCTAQFVTEGARYSHIQQTHYRCPVDGCGYASRTVQGANLHRMRVHEGLNPNKGRKRKPAPEQVARQTGATHDEAKHLLKPQPVALPQGGDQRDSETVRRIRELLGEDPRVAELRRQVDDLLKERDDLKAQLSLIREALHLSS